MELILRTININIGDCVFSQTGSVDAILSTTMLVEPRTTVTSTLNRSRAMLCSQ